MFEYLERSFSHVSFKTHGTSAVVLYRQPDHIFGTAKRCAPQSASSGKQWHVWRKEIHGNRAEPSADPIWQRNLCVFLCWRVVSIFYTWLLDWESFTAPYQYLPASDFPNSPNLLPPCCLSNVIRSLISVQFQSTWSAFSYWLYPLWSDIQLSIHAVHKSRP